MAVTYKRYRLGDGRFIRIIEDETANDSNITYTVPSGFAWEVQGILVEYTATATAGTRLLTVEILDDDDDIVLTIPVATPSVTANQVMRFNLFPAAVSKNPANGAAYGTDPVPPIILPPGYKIKVYDSAAVAAAADDMVTHIHVIEHVCSNQTTGALA